MAKNIPRLSHKEFLILVILHDGPMSKKNIRKSLKDRGIEVRSLYKQINNTIRRGLITKWGRMPDYVGKGNDILYQIGAVLICTERNGWQELRRCERFYKEDLHKLEQGVFGWDYKD